MREVRPAKADHKANPLLSARSLTKVVRGRPLLRDVSLDVTAGHCLAIMGPNGAGKSLLCRVLHGLVSKDQGDILWDGRAATKADRAAQAMVFQHPVMLRRSVRANLRFALNVFGLRGAERRDREDEALELSGLTHLAHQPARVLSGGEQQRLAVARAMIGAPRLLFLDEPTANLDPASTLAVETLVKTAQAKGATLVLVTHDIGQTRRLAQDLVFLQDGQVSETGPVARCLEAPRSAALRAWCAGEIFVTPDQPLAAE